MNPILELIKPFINNEKYDICFYTGKQKEKFLNSLGINCKVLLEHKPTIFEELVNTSKKTNAFVSFNQFKENIKLVPELLVELEKYFEERKTDIVIADFIALPAGMVCNKKNIPWISSMPTPFIIESKTTTPSYLGGWYPREGIFYKTRDFIGRKIMRLAKKIIYFVAKGIIKDLDFQLYNEKGEENVYSPHSILALGMKELEFRDDFPERVKWIGPCLSHFSTEEDKFIKELQYKKKILVTIGTHLLWGKDKLVEIVKKLGEEYKDVCFIISLGDFTKKDEPIEKIEENIYLYKYIDYGAILPVVDYVIHHGGAGILYNCIKYNKPAVIMPFDYDQFDYATRADIAKIALIANMKKEKTIIKAVGKMLEKSEWKELEEISKKYSEYTPSKMLENEIERLINMN